jgi:Tfp pilus assembly protein PilV
MVVLKKIKSATLIEVLIATLLIVIIFMISSLVINNLLLNNFSKNTHRVETHLHELGYRLQNGDLNLPYEEVYEDWQINIKRTQGGITLIAEKGDKTVVKKCIDGNRQN